MSILKDLREKRGKAIEDGRALLNKAQDEKRNLTDEEQTSWDKLYAEQDSMGTQIKTEERQADLDREAAEHSDNRGGDDGGGGNGDPTAEQRMAAFGRCLAFGPAALNADEQRALQVTPDTQGGYLVPPEQFVAQLIQAVDDMVFMRQRATVIPVTSAQSMGAPSLDTDPADATWTTELGTGDEDSSMAFGKRELKPVPLAKRIKVSNKLLQIAALQPESLVSNRLAYKFAITQEKAFLTGTGANQPLGVFTASANGITTGRDVSTGNTTTAIQPDGLIEAKYTLKGAYHPRAAWMFHRDGVKQIAKLKDGDGQYIWRPGITDSDPDRLLGLPLVMSEYAPNTFTTGLYVGILGDFANYWIADAMTLQIQRLVELYAETNQVGFIGRLETDGQPVLEEAFVRVTLA